MKGDGPVRALPGGADSAHHGCRIPPRLWGGAGRRLAPTMPASTSKARPDGATPGLVSAIFPKKPGLDSPALVSSGALAGQSLQVIGLAVGIVI
jgi:hypothetical protein